MLQLDTVLYKVEQTDQDDNWEAQQVSINEISQAIQELKSNYRLLLNLHYIEGYDYEEIVSITGLSYANCRTTISRAKERLKNKLKQYV